MAKFRVCYAVSGRCVRYTPGLSERQARKKLREHADSVGHKLKRGETSFQIPYQANESYHYHEER